MDESASTTAREARVARRLLLVHELGTRPRRQREPCALATANEAGDLAVAQHDRVRALVERSAEARDTGRRQEGHGLAFQLLPPRVDRRGDAGLDRGLFLLHEH